MPPVLPLRNGCTHLLPGPACRGSCSTVRTRCRTRSSHAARPAEDERLPSPQDAAFIHTDPWRIHRITSEFVAGFDALAEVGLAVSMFGSASKKSDDPMYAAAEATGAELGAGRLLWRWPGDHGGLPGIFGGGRHCAIGAGIELPHEPRVNGYLDLALDFGTSAFEDDVREVRRSLSSSRAGFSFRRDVRIAFFFFTHKVRMFPDRALRQGLLGRAQPPGSESPLKRRATRLRRRPRARPGGGLAGADGRDGGGLHNGDVRPRPPRPALKLF